MESSEFPRQAIRRTPPELLTEGERRPALYERVESSPVEVDASYCYVSFADYWRLVIRHRMTLVGFAMTGLTLAVLISLVQTPLYRARTSVQVQDFNENFLDLSSVDPTSTGNFLTAQSYFQTQIKLLQSESLLERVIKKLNLEKAQRANGRRPFASLVRRLLRSSSAPPPTTHELIQQAKDRLTVSAAGETRLLEVQYESPDPRLAADFANTLVSEFIEQSQEMRWKSAQHTGAWLTTHLDEMKAKLEHSEAQLQDYARTSGLTFTSENNKVSDVRLKDVQEELSKAQADRVAKEAKFEEAKNKPAESLPEMLDDAALRDYRVKLTDLRRQSVELGATLTPEHYKVRRVQAQITELESAVQKERRLILRRIGNEYEAARRREALLAASYAQQEKIVAEQSAKAIRYDTLKREVDSSRQLYQVMLERVKQAELASAMRVSNVLVVDPAEPPLFPYRPRLLMNSGLGLFSGIFLGLGFVLLRRHFDRTIRAPGETQGYLNLPELGVLPLAELSSGAKLSSTKQEPFCLAPSSDPAPDSLTRDCPELATWSSKASLLAECIRGAVTSLLLAEQDGDCRAVVLTSVCGGDGKTTVASNLSIALAETGRQVLLIDADLHRPRLHKIFGVSHSPGLSDVLCGNTPLDDAIPIVQFAYETKVPGLCILPSGRCTINSSSPFFSAHMPTLLRRARREFDTVVIDAPPMIQLTDARLLARLADGVILVLRAGRTTPASALFVSQRFANDGTRVLGTILNYWDPNITGGYSYYGRKEFLGDLASKGRDEIWSGHRA